MKKFFKWLASLPKNLPAYTAYVRKAIIQVIGLAGALLALGLLPGDYAAYVATGIGVLTTILHYLTPNTPLPEPVEIEDPSNPATPLTPSGS